MLILTDHCKRCGREFVPAPCHVYKIGAELFCSYTCHLHEVQDREEAKRKKEAQALERKRLRDKKRLFDRYRFNKNNMEPILEDKHPGRHPFPVLKIRVSDGEVVARYESIKAAAEGENLSEAAMSKRIRGLTTKRPQEFIFQYEKKGAKKCAEGGNT